LFKEPDPNPTLELFLDLMEAAGARFHGVVLNKPKAVIKRLKEVMTRENVSTLSALSTVSGVNRSQLSTMWNQKEPNPMLATFDRLVVALGAEQDFVLVNLHDAEVAAALAAGEAEVQTAKQVVRSHIYSVPGLSSEAAKRAEAEVHEFVNARIDELTTRIRELYKKNIALEKLRDDQAAELVRFSGLNATLELEYIIVLPPKEIPGVWIDEEFGTKVLKKVGNEIWGTYVHDEGTVVGTYADGLFILHLDRGRRPRRP